MYGTGNLNTAQFWEYDTRLGRRWNMDRVTKPWQSPYACFSEDPISRVDPNGDDDYKLDKKGNVSLKRKTNSETDKLIARSGFLGLKKSVLDVNKGVLNNQHSGEFKEGDETIKYNYFGIVGEQAGKELFEFVAKNTNVEWGLSKFGEGSLQTNILSTSHQETREGGITDLFKSPLFKSSDFRGYDHSHPGGEWHPSGSVHPIGDPDRQGDVKAAEIMQGAFSGRKLVFRIFTATDAKYTTYDSKTYIPLELKEVEIIGTKPK